MGFLLLPHNQGFDIGAILVIPQDFQKGQGWTAKGAGLDSKRGRVGHLGAELSNAQVMAEMLKLSFTASFVSCLDQFTVGISIDK